MTKTKTYRGELSRVQLLGGLAMLQVAVCELRVDADGFRLEGPEKEFTLDSELLIHSLSGAEEWDRQCRLWGGPQHVLSRMAGAEIWFRAEGDMISELALAGPETDPLFWADWLVTLGIPHEVDIVEIGQSGIGPWLRERGVLRPSDCIDAQAWCRSLQGLEVGGRWLFEGNSWSLFELGVWGAKTAALDRDRWSMDRWWERVQEQQQKQREREQGQQAQRRQWAAARVEAERELKATAEAEVQEEEEIGPPHPFAGALWLALGEEIRNWNKVLRGEMRVGPGRIPRPTPLCDTLESIIKAKAAPASAESPCDICPLRSEQHARNVRGAGCTDAPVADITTMLYIHQARCNDAEVQEAIWRELRELRHVRAILADEAGITAAVAVVEEDLGLRQEEKEEG